MSVLVLNCAASDDSLVDGIRSASAESGKTTTVLKAREVILSLSGAEVIVYQQANKIPFLFEQAFVRGRGLHAHMSSLLVRLLKKSQCHIYGSLSAGEFTNNDGKITQMVDLTLAGLPIPRTLVFAKNNIDFVPDIAREQSLQFPLVLKRTGSKGSCVWKVESFGEVEKYLVSAQSHELFLLQEFIPNTFDIRALYFQKQFLGAMARTSTDGFYNNASKGAGVTVIEMTSAEHELSIRACAVLQQDFAGVDIVRSDRGPLLFEVNNRPGFEGFERATGVNVGHAIAEIMLSFRY